MTYFSTFHSHFQLVSYDYICFRMNTYEEQAFYLISVQ